MSAGDKLFAQMEAEAVLRSILPHADHGLRVARGTVNPFAFKASTPSPCGEARALRQLIALFGGSPRTSIPLDKVPTRTYLEGDPAAPRK